MCSLSTCTPYVPPSLSPSPSLSLSLSLSLSCPTSFSSWGRFSHEGIEGKVWIPRDIKTTHSKGCKSLLSLNAIRSLS